jgi:hypothetical protein
MLVDVYKSASNPQRYLSVPAGTDPTKSSIAKLDSDCQTVSPFMIGIEMAPSQPRVGFDNVVILRDIDEHGFAAHSVVISVTTSTR